MLSLSALDILALTIATIFTSGFAAALGQGGGLMLFAILAIYFELPLLITLHGVIQIFSNSSRAALALPHIQWRLVAPILIGTVLGAIAITPALAQTNWSGMQAIMGAYILLLTWQPRLSITIKIPGTMLVTGLLQGSLGMLLGATGPLTNALLLSKGIAKDSIVASNAVIMTTSHIIKVMLFAALGVSVWLYLDVLIILSAAAILGSYIGTRIRHKLSARLFGLLFKWLLSALALRMLLLGMPFI